MMHIELYYYFLHVLSLLYTYLVLMPDDDIFTKLFELHFYTSLPLNDDIFYIYI